MSEIKEQKITYYALTLDPVHLGTGGYRLGRVDNSIIREPGTNLPKIPGSSIAGVTRAYTAMAIQSENPMILEKQKYQRIRLDKSGNPIVKKDKDGNQLLDSYGEPVYGYDSCAGKGGEKGEEHCGSRNCPVCTAFGFSKGEKGESFQGLAQFSDLRILFFPVYSMKGPVWITSPLAIKEFINDLPKVDEDKFRPINNGYLKDLNFGWLLLQPDATNGNLPFNLPGLPEDEKFSKFCGGHILNNAFILPDRLFSHIVNDNLEIRTSVAIDPLTGAAESGALYTYEAIPRTTLLWFDVFYNDPNYFKIPKWNERDNKVEQMDIKKDNAGGNANWDWIRTNVEKGFRLMEFMGIGGMGTRGFGRMNVILPKKNKEVKNDTNSKS